MQLLSTISSIVNFALLIGTCLGLLPKFYKSLRSVERIKDDIYKRLDKLDENQCKNYLVRFLSDIESGQSIDEIEKERAYEVYDWYVSEGHNGYIKSRWNKCVERGLL